MSQFTGEVLGPLTDTELRATPVPISGTVTATPTGTQVVSATDLDVRDLTHVSDSVKVGDGTDTLAVNADGSINVNATQGGTPTATVTRVAVSTTVATLQASNAARKRLIVHNETGTLFVKLGSAATNNDYTYRLTGNTMVEIDFYTGIVTAIKGTGNSDAQVTEIA